MKETWTDIPGLEGKYQISNMGRYKKAVPVYSGEKTDGGDSSSEPESGKGSQGKAWKKGTCI